MKDLNYIDHHFTIWSQKSAILSVYMVITDFSLNLFIFAQLRSKFSQLIYITLQFASWNQPVLVLYEESWL